MSDPRDRPSVKPPEDDPKQPPVPEGEPSRTTEEAAREDMAIRGAAAGGALSGAAGYAGGAMTGRGGAIGMHVMDEEIAEAEADEETADEPEKPDT